MKQILKYTLLLTLTSLIAFYFWPEKSLTTNKKITRLVVEKSKRELHVYSERELLKTYKIALGFNPVGHKEFEGDGKTPEGIYTINDKNPKSAYYLNLGISYPNKQDREAARKLGKSPGGDIKIHGMKNGSAELVGNFHRINDWTHGCIALTNEEAKELFDNVPVGTPIEIKK